MSSAVNRMNVFAPPALNGFPALAGNGFVPMFFGPVFRQTLTANQLLTNASVAVDNDADFALRALQVTANTGQFELQVYDSQGYRLTNGFTNSLLFQVGGTNLPFPISEIVIQAGGRIGIDIRDLSGATNTIEIVFLGVKRYII